MEAYYKVEKPRDKAADNEIRINKKTRVVNYVRYVLDQFREKGATEVTLQTMGDAIPKITSIVEIVKYRVRGLY